MINLRTTGLRLALSLGLAFALWVFVSYTENPDRTTSLGEAQVEPENLSPGLILTRADGKPLADLPSVILTVEADQATTNNIRISDFRAYADLSGLGQGAHTVPVNVAPTRPGLNQVVTSISPEQVRFHIDEQITRTLPLTIELTGSVPFSFEQREPSATVNNRPVTEVAVTGPENLVTQVAQVRATANIDRLTANFESTRQLEALDADGQVIEGVTVVPDAVRVRVPIVSSVGLKRVPIVPQTVGEPGDGYVVTDVSVDPQFVNLTGGSSVLDEVERVYTVDVDVSGASETITQTVDLLRPPLQVGFQSGEPTTATVRVRIEPITRPFRVRLPVAVNAINGPSALLVSLDPQIIDVPLTGTAAQLATLNATTLQAVIDLAGYRAGTYTITPDVRVPDGIALDGSVPSVTVTLRVPSAPPQPTATGLPTATAVLTPTDAPPSATAAPVPSAGPPVETTVPAP